MSGQLKSSEKQKNRLDIAGIGLIVLWFVFDHITNLQPDFFYGQYGALIIGLLTGVVAKAKGRNFFFWFGIGTWFVLAAFIVLLFFPKLHDALCPHCREPVDIHATVCPHCQRDFVETEMIVTDMIAKKCPNCGSLNRWQDYTCINCSKPI